MKKIIIAVIFLLVFISGCNKKQKVIETNSNSDATETEQSVSNAEEKSTQSTNVAYNFEGRYLKKVIIDGKVVVENDYNNIGKRSTKKGVDNCKFTYDENKNLIMEERNGKVITYFYKEDEEYQYWHIIGFSYEGNDYYYTRDEKTRINGIQNEKGELIAKYEYSLNNNKVEKVMKSQGEEWVCTEDEEFIGNINRIRDISEYFDIECDLYYQYNGIFYNAVTNEVIN